MIVIGIDPGLAIVGFGVIRADEKKNTPVSYGCIRTPEGLQVPARLAKIYDEVSLLLDKYSPEAVAVEKLFFAKNVTNAMSVSEARGVICLAAEQRKIPVFEYTPSQVKQSITGSGKADKKQMQQMIMRLLSLDEIPTPDDAADGLSIALCHIHIVKYRLFH